MATIGNEKQEKKLVEFAKIAKRFFPDISDLEIKGAFRKGANAAIEKSHLSNWNEMAEQSISVRREFFNSLLQEVRPHLIGIIGKEKVDDFLEKVRVENEQYIKD